MVVVEGDVMNQSEQLEKLMNGQNELLTAMRESEMGQQFCLDVDSAINSDSMAMDIDFESKKKSKQDSGVADMVNEINQKDEGSGKRMETTLEGGSVDKAWDTPEAVQVQKSECHIVGNKFYSLINDESHHSKWEEFRKLAMNGTTTEECSDLLKRLELEASDEELEIGDDETMTEQEESYSLGDLTQADPTVEEKSEVMKEKENQNKQKRKNKWGPNLRMPRPRRYLESGQTVMEKAQELKKFKNLEQGTKPIASFAFESNESLLAKATSVKISFGIDTCATMDKIEHLKRKEIMSRTDFEDRNPEVNLPADLDVNLVTEDFPPLVNRTDAPLKECFELGEQSWAKVASKSCERNKSSVSNDRSGLEC